MATQVNFISSKGTKIISTDEDATLDTDDRQIHVFSDTDPVPVPPPNVVITLPCNPQIGEEHKIVAATANVTLDGNGFPVVHPGNLTPNEVPAGSCLNLVFSADPALDKKGCDCNGNGGNGAWYVC